MRPTHGVITHRENIMRKVLAATAAVLVMTGGSAAAGVAVSATTGGHAKNSSGSDWSRHIYVCDTLDAGHEMEGQARMGGYTAFVRDSAGGSCGHMVQSTSIKEFRSCRLKLIDNCGGWVAPRR